MGFRWIDDCGPHEGTLFADGYVVIDDGSNFWVGDEDMEEFIDQVEAGKMLAWHCAPDGSKVWNFVSGRESRDIFAEAEGQDRQGGESGESGAGGGAG